MPIERNYIGHWICSPSCAFTDLPIKIQEYNNWLSSPFSGIEWFDGNVPHRQLYSNLRELTRTARTIYSYDKNSVKLLESITTRNVVNLSDLGYTPSISKGNQERMFCYHHGSLQRESFSCALTNAEDIKNWLLLKNTISNHSDEVINNVDAATSEALAF